MRLVGHPVVPDRILGTEEVLSVLYVRAVKWLDEVAGTDLEDVAYRRESRAADRWWAASERDPDPRQWRWTFIGWAWQFEPWCSSVEERRFAEEVDAVIAGRDA